MNQPVVHNVGNNKWPRYQTVNDSRVWTGNSWSEQQEEARLFLDRDEADQVCGLLPSTRRFCTSIMVTVMASENYSLEDLQEFLDGYKSAIYQNSQCKTEVVVDVNNLTEIT